MSQVFKKVAQRSLHIQNSLGTRCAAGYLRNREVSLESALELLAGRAQPVTWATAWAAAWGQK